MWIKASKLFFALLIMYYGWFQVVFFAIPKMLLLLGVCMIGTISVHAFFNKVNLFSQITVELKFWIVFAFTSYIFGLFVARSQSNLTSSVITFVQFLILIFGIVYISSVVGSIDFFVKFFVFFTFVCTVTTFLRGVNYVGGRISMGENNNPNLLGIIMALGVCCILYITELKKMLHSIISFSLIFLFTFVTMLTGSRKSFLSLVLIIAFWILFIVNKEIKELNPVTKIKGVFTFLIILTIGYFVLYPYFKHSLIINRLFHLFAGGDSIREGMYRIAFDLFKRSPVVGLGLDNYRIVSGYGTYSHSTYAEALSCTGLIGTFLYFTPYIIIIYKFFGLAFNKKIGPTLLKQSRIMAGLFAVLLFLGIGIIHFYEMVSTIGFGVIIAFCNLNKRKKDADETFGNTQ